MKSSIKRNQTDQERSIALMWNWVGSAFFSEGLFAAGFVILPNPNLTKALLAAALFVIHFLLVYYVRYYRQCARFWFLFGTMWFLNLACFTAGLAMDVCFRFQWPEDMGSAVLILVCLTAVAFLTWRYYTPILRALHEQDTRTGRFDLTQGLFSLLIAPSLYEFKTPILRKAMAILLPSSGMLIAISAASGVHGGDRLLRGRDIGAGALFIFIAVMSVGTAACAFYTYRFIRRWERQTGRTMWIKGFEPKIR